MMNDTPPTYEEQVVFFKNHLKTNGGIEIFIKHLLSEGCGQQTIHTPFTLCREIMKKLNEYTKLDGKSIAILFNLELLHVLVRNYNIPPKNITIFVDDEREFEFARLEYGMIPDANLFYIDIKKTITTNQLHSTKGEVMKKFDVICGNPPYQEGNRKHGGVCASNILWEKFVVRANDLLKDNGYLAMVHPSGWRKPNHRLQEILTGNQLHYLEIHDEKDGLKTFGAETRYDWYVMQKTRAFAKTIIKGQDGNITQANIANWQFIPNYEFALIQKLLAKPNESKVEILHSYSAYETRKAWMSKTKTSEYRYPCVYISKKGGPSLMYSSKKGGHFTVPKVIYSTGRPISVGFYLDAKGEYGLTQFASGIVDDPHILPQIQAALNTEKFRKFCSAISIGKLEINTTVLKLFRKDFWKEFAVS